MMNHGATELALDFSPVDRAGLETGAVCVTPCPAPKVVLVDFR